jgi:hypothetical protein
MSFPRHYVLNALLLSLLLLGSTTASQTQGRRQPTTKYLETERLSPEAFDLPLRIKPELAGGFAELRVNHLHSGIDFKTLKQVGLPIYAPADGWVSRIRISSFGFGYALYLDHPNGFTTVYGHLQGYADPIASVATDMQYRRESFELDTMLPARRMPVRKGQLIAYSGNSGISAAPHLHFEIRDTRTEETIDPLLWYSDRMVDHTAPKPTKIAVFAVEGEGVLSTGKPSAVAPVFRNKQGKWATGPIPSVWGKIGLGLSAYDFMDGNSNLYGICSIRLFLNDELIFQQDLSRFNFDQTRCVNSLIDYETMRRSNSWIMKSYVEPGNRLNVYPILKDRGFVQINEQKKYSFRYELMDRFGNATEFGFDLQGRKKAVPAKQQTGQRMIYWLPNYISQPDFKLELPAWSLEQTLGLAFEQRPDKGLSDLFRIHRADVPVLLPYTARFRIHSDTLAEKRQYYLAKIAGNGAATYVPADYEQGWMVAELKDFGTYKVLSDTVLPKISRPNLERMAKNDVLRIRIADNASGIKTWRGTIDGKWALFALDGKSGWLSCVLDSMRVKPDQSHELKLSVTDGCGNRSSIHTVFAW